MKHLWKSVLPFAASVVLIACGNNSDNKTAEHDGQDHATMEKQETASEPAGTQTASVQLKDDQLNAVYQHYIHLTTALTNSDAAEAKNAANAIAAGAKDLQGGKAIETSATKIINASGIEAQRAAYEDLSKQMMEQVKSSGVSNGALYVQYCPMAFDNKGASWISSSKEIRNPYFGEKMLKCGEVKETIQ